LEIVKGELLKETHQSIDAIDGSPGQCRPMVGNYCTTGEKNATTKSEDAQGAANSNKNRALPRPSPGERASRRETANRDGWSALAVCFPLAGYQK